MNDKNTSSFFGDLKVSRINILSSLVGVSRNRIPLLWKIFANVVVRIQEARCDEVNSDNLLMNKLTIKYYERAPWEEVHDLCKTVKSGSRRANVYASFANLYFSRGRFDSAKESCEAWRQEQMSLFGADKKRYDQQMRRLHDIGMMDRGLKGIYKFAGEPVGNDLAPEEYAHFSYALGVRKSKVALRVVKWIIGNQNARALIAENKKLRDASKSRIPTTSIIDFKLAKELGMPRKIFLKNARECNTLDSSD